MGAHAAVWRNSPGLYYALISEIINRAVALHGLPGSDDFDVKLVRCYPRLPARVVKPVRNLTAPQAQCHRLSNSIALAAQQKSYTSKLGFCGDAPAPSRHHLST